MEQPQNESKQVFISYGREPDAIRFVEQLKQDLLMSGFTVWVDSADIDPGSDWRAEITTGVEQCRFFIPVITQKYVSSRYCVNELYAADGGQKDIFPIFFADVDFGVSEMAKGVKFVIGSINWTMCRPGVDNYALSTERLVKALREKVKAQTLEKNEDSTGTKETSASHGVAKLSIDDDASVTMPLIPQSKKPVKTLLGLKNPNGVAVSHDNKILVTNMETHTVVVFDENYNKVGTIGGQGIEDGKFFCPFGVVVDQDNHVIITCSAVKCIQKFTVDGKFLRSAGKAGQGACDFQGPNGIAISKEGKIYVCDLGNHRIQMLSSDLEFLGSFSATDPEYGSGSLNHPNGIAINSQGIVYVADMLGHCIQVFSAEGKYLSRIGKQGHLTGCLTSPMCITVDEHDNIYVGDAMSRISTFNKHGVFVRCFGERGLDLGMFGTIRGICLDASNRLYVCEWQTNRLQIFQ